MIDYQFKVTHETTSSGPLFWWSQPRKTLIITARVPGSVPPIPTGEAGVNLIPSLAPSALTRPLSSEVTTSRGSMFAVDSFFCGNLPLDTVTTVPVPPLTWGVRGVNIESVNAPFDVQLIDNTNPSSPVTLATLAVSSFPSNTPLVRQDNYNGRASSIRVISNPSVEINGAPATVQGCFTEPGTSQPGLDPGALLIRVDPGTSVQEGNEGDNELSF